MIYNVKEMNMIFQIALMEPGVFIIAILNLNV